MSICIPCTRAGIYLTNARNTPDQVVSDVLVSNAKLAHEKCRGGTWCDCQHSVNIKGELNTRLIAELAHAADTG
jgi:hypothetical protein